MNYQELENEVSSFLANKKWIRSEETGRTVFTKDYNPDFDTTKKAKFLLNDNAFHQRLVEAFKGIDLPREVLNLIKSEQGDTDLVIAGLQIATNKLKDGDSSPKSFYAFQPVTRFNSMDKNGKDQGFLSSFVNLCTVDTNTSMEQYLERVNNWISVLSKLSLHSSGLKLTLKSMQDEVRDYNGLKFSNGMKLHFAQKGIPIGVANIFQVDCEDKKILLSDIGFSYERLLWAINGHGQFFKPLFPNFEVLHGDYKKNDRIRTSTLMTSTGIRPSSDGVGSKVRGMIAETCDLHDGNNIKDMVSHYYDYYSKFITPQMSLDETQDTILDEVTRNKKKIIVGGSLTNSMLKRSVDELCGEKVMGR